MPLIVLPCNIEDPVMQRHRTVVCFSFQRLFPSGVLVSSEVILELQDELSSTFNPGVLQNLSFSATGSFKRQRSRRSSIRQCTPRARPTNVDPRDRLSRRRHCCIGNWTSMRFSHGKDRQHLRSDNDKQDAASRSRLCKDDCQR